MAQDLILNQKLKEVWKLEERILAGEMLSSKEKAFYNEYLPVIQKYYKDNGDYWKGRSPIVE